MLFATTLTSLLLGTALAVMRVSGVKMLRAIGTLYVEVCRNIPALFWILFFYFVFPDLLPSRWGQILNGYQHYPIAAGILGLTVDNSSFVSDILRSGKLAIPDSQKEAAASLGLNSLQQWGYVMLPQMYRAVLPPLGTRMIHNFKNTSLCMAISVKELTWATQNIESLTFRGIESTTIATVFYIVACGIMVKIIIWLERYLKIDITSITKSRA
ncbi:MAG: amino acid ABC transporter permease [Deferribacteres bacterium]|nr:amino acid ABC transporter permease [Deferribacteres bacterium]